MNGHECLVFRSKDRTSPSRAAEAAVHADTELHSGERGVRFIASPDSAWSTVDTAAAASFHRSIECPCQSLYTVLAGGLYTREDSETN